MGGEDDSQQVNTGSGGWSVYKRLVMRLVETCVKDCKDLSDRVTRLETDLKQLRGWVEGNDNKADDVRDRVVTTENDLLSIKDSIKGLKGRLEKHSETTNQVVRDHTPSPGVLVEIWRHPIGKVLASIAALAALLAAGAAYNAVSVAQVDINNHLPRSEDRPPP